MERLSWGCYAFVYIAFSMMGITYMIVESDSMLRPVIACVALIIHLIGLYGFVYKEAIWSRKVWRFFFWWILIGTTFNTISFVLSDALIDAVVMLVISGPLLVVFYLYSRVEHPVWKLVKDELLDDLAQRLQQLGEITRKVSENRDNVLHETEVTLRQEDKEYRVFMTKSEGSETQRFENSFTSMRQVADFLDAHTVLRATDFIAN